MRAGFCGITRQHCLADVNECKKNLDDCDLNANCTDTKDSFICECNSGFNGTGKICEDINECLDNNGGCHPDADCNNSIGSHSCKCKPGYSGDGMTCTGTVLRRPWTI